MIEYKDVLVQWHDDPDNKFATTVVINKVWTEEDEENDSHIFFYFSNTTEYEEAKQPGDNGYEFRIHEYEEG